MAYKEALNGNMPDAGGPHPYGQPPQPPDRFNSMQQEAKLLDPIRRVEELENAPTIWQDVEHRLQFYFSYGKHRKPQFTDPHAFIQAVRHSVAGHSDTKLAEQFNTSRMSVRNARVVIHRMLSYVLPEETQMAIGLPAQQPLPTDAYVLETYHSYAPLVSRLAASEKMYVLATSNRHLYDATTTLASGQYLSALIPKYGAEGFVSLGDAQDAAQEFRDILIYKKYPDDALTGGTYRFLQRLLFAEYISLHNLFDTDDALLAAISFIENHPSFIRDNRLLFDAQRFIKNTPRMERQLAEAHGVTFLPVHDLPVDASPEAFFTAYRTQGVLPYLYRHIFKKTAENHTPATITAELRTAGADNSHETIQRWVWGFLRFSENVLLNPRLFLRRLSRETRVNELARNRRGEVAQVLQYLRTHQN